MTFRPFKIFLLLFQAVWLVFVLPGHTRGLLSYAKSASGPAVHSCCGVESKPSKTKEPTEEQKAKCAICFFAAALSHPPTIKIVVPELGLLKILPLTASIQAAEQRFIQTYYACGPPVAA